jgi:hypothetical protein
LHVAADDDDFGVAGHGISLKARDPVTSHLHLVL